MMNNTNIKNYTSTVAVANSVARIEHNLVRAGARNIGKSYDENGNLAGIMFQLALNGIPLTFKLPAKWQQVKQRLLMNVRRPRPGTEKKIEEQAQRTAWKLLLDKVEVDVSNILLDQIEPMEAFMPYLYDGERDRTLYEYHKERGFKAMLPEGKR